MISSRSPRNCSFSQLHYVMYDCCCDFYSVALNIDIDCPFQLAAIALIAVGAYVQIALKDYFDLIEGSFSSAAALLIAVGVIIFFIAFFGCCGAYKENRTCVLIVSWLI